MNNKIACLSLIIIGILISFSCNRQPVGEVTYIEDDTESPSKLPYAETRFGYGKEDRKIIFAAYNDCLDESNQQAHERFPAGKDKQRLELRDQLESQCISKLAKKLDLSIYQIDQIVLEGTECRW